MIIQSIDKTWKCSIRFESLDFLEHLTSQVVLAGFIKCPCAWWICEEALPPLNSTTSSSFISGYPWNFFLWHSVCTRRANAQLTRARIVRRVTFSARLRAREIKNENPKRKCVVGPLVVVVVVAHIHFGSQRNSCRLEDTRETETHAIVPWERRMMVQEEEARVRWGERVEERRASSSSRRRKATYKLRAGIPLVTSILGWTSKPTCINIFRLFRVATKTQDNLFLLVFSLHTDTRITSQLALMHPPQDIVPMVPLDIYFVTEHPGDTKRCRDTNDNRNCLFRLAPWTASVCLLCLSSGNFVRPAFSYVVAKFIKPRRTRIRSSFSQSLYGHRIYG